MRFRSHVVLPFAVARSVDRLCPMPSVLLYLSVRPSVCHAPVQSTGQLHPVIRRSSASVRGAFRSIACKTPGPPPPPPISELSPSRRQPSCMPRGSRSSPSTVQGKPARIARDEKVAANHSVKHVQIKSIEYDFNNGRQTAT